MIVIDGCHRLYRAYHEGRLAVPGYLFTSAETQRILAAGEGQQAEETFTEHAVRTAREGKREHHVD